MAGEQDGLRFERIPYQRVEFDALALGARRNRLHLRLALSPSAAVKAVGEMQSLMRHYATMSTLARIRHDIRTVDPFYSEEVAYYDDIDAKVTQLCQIFYSTLLTSSWRAELEEAYGGMIFRKAQNLREIMQNVILEDAAEENRLVSAFRQRMSAASVQISGQALPLSQLEPLQQSPDRLIRQQVQHALAGFLETQRDGLDQLFDELVAVRTRISRKLGLTNFSELGQKRLERFDVLQAQTENLRKAIIRYIVPLTREIRRLQRHRLKLEHLYYFDLPCLLPEGNPHLRVTPGEMPAAASGVMSALTGETPSFLQKIIDGGFLDIEARIHKTQGRRCSTLFNVNMPFIFMNAGGSFQDAATLMHEAGHAYAALRSLPGLRLIEYHKLPAGLGEIHSTAMEYLAYPHMDRFFGESAEDYTLLHMTESMLFIPYGCLVDEFSHRVHQQPRMTPDQRHQTWLELEKIYLPDLDYGDEPFYADGCAWQKNESIFAKPFSLFDDVIAQMVSLDIWQMSRQDPGQARQCYDKLCSLGGGGTLPALLGQAGLESPFDIGAIKKVTFAVADFMDL